MSPEMKALRRNCYSMAAS